jgi:hypothetical protein
MGVTACVSIAWLAHPICGVWLGGVQRDFRVTAFVLVIQLGTVASSFLAGAAWPILVGRRRLRFLIWTDLPTTALSVTLSLLVARHTSWGVAGVLAPALVLGWLHRPLVVWYVCRVLDVRLLTCLRLSYVGPAKVALALTIPGFALFLLLRSSSNTLSVALGAMAMVVIATALSWTVGFTAEDRAAAKGLIRSVVARS